MVTIVLPTKDEAESVKETISIIRHIKKDYRIVVVDAHSTDNTVEIAKEMGVEVIFDHGKGKGEALRTAFKHVDDDVIFTDVDLTYPLDKIPEIEEGLKTHDCVFGYRNQFLANSLPKVFILSDFFSRFTFFILFRRRYDNLSGLRGLTKDAIRHLDLKEDGFGIETEITTKSAQGNYSVLNIPISYAPRLGTSKFNPFMDGFVVFKSLFKYFFVFKVLYMKKLFHLDNGQTYYRNTKNKVKGPGFLRDFFTLVGEYTKYF